MKAIVTGSNGTLGTVLCKCIKDKAGEVVGWDRGEAHPGHEDAARAFIEKHQPTVIFHTALPSQSTGIENEGWLVNEKWTTDIAKIAGEKNIPFVYTSTVMVFTNKAQGPFAADHEPDETEGYGQSKLLGEKAAKDANSDARIARLGWQIGDAPGSNNMIHYLDQQLNESGEIRASTLWLPATSFLEDTANALINISGLEPGTYHIDSNRGWNYYEIVCALNELHGGTWKITPTEDFSQNQQMVDERPRTAPLSSRLKLPPKN